MLREPATLSDTDVCERNKSTDTETLERTLGRAEN